MYTPYTSPHTSRKGFNCISVHALISDSSNCLLGPVTRLVGGRNPREGRVEVFHDGVWGTVCDDGWGIEDVNVVCRELGFPGTARLNDYGGQFGQGDGQIWLDEVTCTGSETQLSDCGHGGWGNHNCGHYEDVGAICGGNESVTYRETKFMLENRILSRIRIKLSYVSG